MNKIFVIFHKRLIVQIKIIFLDDWDEKLDFYYIFVQVFNAMDKVPYLVLEFDLFIHFKLKEKCIFFSAS